MQKCPECKYSNTSTDLYCRVCGGYLAKGRINSDYRDLFISLIIGLVLWGCFYNYVIEIFINSGTYFYRILTIHWICRLVSLIFFWAGTYLLIKYFAFRKEKRDFVIFTQSSFSSLICSGITEQNADQVLNAFQEKLGRKKFTSFASSLVFTRFQKTIEFLKAVPRREEIHDILSYRAELDMASIQSQFSIVKIFSWVMPILGFIGTVLGISAAIKGFSGNISGTPLNTAVPQEFTNQIMQGLNSVTGGLTTAFDTTYIALMLVIPITFAVGFLEKSYDDYLNFLENYFLSAVVPHLLIGHHLASTSDSAAQSITDLEELTHRWKNIINPTLNDFQETAVQLNYQLKYFTEAVTEFNKHLLLQQNKVAEK